MRQSTKKYLFLAGTALVTTGIAMLLGMDHAFAQQGTDFATSYTSTYSNQVGAAAKLAKDGSVPLGFVMSAGGAYGGYKALKDDEVSKKGVGTLVKYAAMMGMGGLVIYAGSLIDKGAATANLTNTPLTNTSGGNITWTPQ
jgi:hypothetical protein